MLMFGGCVSTEVPKYGTCGFLFVENLFVTVKRLEYLFKTCLTNFQGFLII